MENDHFSSFLIESPSQFLHHVNDLPSTNNNEVASLIQSSPDEDITKCQKLKPRRKKKGMIDTDLSNTSLCGYKLKVMYGGYFRTMKSVKKKKYCSGKQKTLYLDLVASNFGELFEEITALYNWEENQNLLLYFLDKNANCQSFIQLQDEHSYEVMVSLYKDANDLVIYVVKESNGNLLCDTQKDGASHEENVEVMEISENADEHAARTYSPNRYQNIISAIDGCCPKAMQFLREEHYKLWSRSQFGTGAKCDYITNNISETFNSWVAEERKNPVLILLDSIRQKIMVKFSERRKMAKRWKGPLVPKVQEYIRYISRNLSGYVVLPSMEHCAEVQYKERRWEVNLEDRTCSCRAWQVKGVPCVHAAALIASRRNAKWEDYVDSYFTIDRFKMAYAIGIPPMPSRQDWTSCDLGYKMFPPIIKRPSGRPRKNRIKPTGEKKKKRFNKCSRCGMQGHHRNTCKNDVSLEQDEGTSEITEPTQKSTNPRSKKKVKAKTKKWGNTDTLLKLLQDNGV